MQQLARTAGRPAASATAQAFPTPAISTPPWATKKTPNRRSPAIAFASAKGLLAFPVNGNKIRDFGGSDGAGGADKGLSLATHAPNQGTNPRDGQGVLSRPLFRFWPPFILNCGCR